MLTDLARTFPNTQFIVSTHSPPVLTTTRPEHVVALRREGGNVVAEQAAAPTYGAEAGDVLATVMGVDERPRGNEFVRLLDDYLRLVDAGRSASPDAVRLRRRLESLSPRDPALDQADVEIRVCRTIDTLCLNVERLRRARARRWRALSANWGDWLDDAEVLAAAARAELLPDDAGRLPRFFTTSRSFFGPLGEQIPAEELREWI